MPSESTSSGSFDQPDLRVEPKEADSSLGELFAELTGELGDLVKTEIELAKTETKEEVTKAGKAGGMFAAAALTAYLTLLFLSFTVAWLLDMVMPRALAFAIVAVLYAVATFALYKMARKELDQIQGLPNTVESIKENT